MAHVADEPANLEDLDAVGADLELLRAERAIQRVISTYAHRVDARDYDAVAQCYWPDAIDRHVGFEGPVAAFVAWLAEVLPLTDTSTHHFSNVLINVDLVAGTATSEAGCHNVTVWGPQTDGTARHMTSALRYRDQWQRRGEEWRIAVRECTRDWQRVETVQTT